MFSDTEILFNFSVSIMHAFFYNQTREVHAESLLNFLVINDPRIFKSKNPKHVEKFYMLIRLSHM